MNTLIDFISRDFKAFDVKETVAQVQDFFLDVSFSHFPVVEHNVYIGSIAANDVETFDFNKKLEDYKYTLEGFFARNNMVWLDVLEVFAKNETNVVPVLDTDNKYLGYYELEDVMRFFQDTPFLKEQGNILVVQKPALEYSMSQIAQIVESNNGKILGVFVSNLEVDNVEVTIKIAVGSVNEIIQTFRRYNYEIISKHEEDSYLESLKERSEYLDKYLKI